MPPHKFQEYNNIDPDTLQGLQDDDQIRARDLQLLIHCESGNVRIVRDLLDTGANPNFVHHEETPLINACTIGKESVIQLLLERGADPILPSEEQILPDDIVDNTRIQCMLFKEQGHRVDMHGNTGIDKIDAIIALLEATKRDILSNQVD